MILTKFACPHFPSPRRGCVLCFFAPCGIISLTLMVKMHRLSLFPENGKFLPVKSHVNKKGIPLCRIVLCSNRRPRASCGVPVSPYLFTLVVLVISFVIGRVSDYVQWDTATRAAYEARLGIDLSFLPFCHAPFPGAVTLFVAILCSLLSVILSASAAARLAPSRRSSTGFSSRGRSSCSIS